MADRPRLPRTLLPRTLRGRLIAGLVALFAVACAMVSLVIYLAVRHSLQLQLNNQLQTASNLANTCLDRHLPANDADGDHDGDYTSGEQAPSLQTHPGPAQGMAGWTCDGLTDDALWGFADNGRFAAQIVPNRPIALSAADRERLLAITPSRLPAPGQNMPAHTLDLRSAGGTFALTVVRDPGSGATYFTGLPLSGMNDLLRDIALVETAVSGVVLVLAGVTGTLWVRLSLRPLRRVAATASHVAELPLESGEIAMPRGVPDADPGTETGQLGLAFNRMLGHVENALRRRAASEARLRRFAADASHELRTPLAAIRGYAELGLLHPGDSPEAVTHALGRVLSESTRMSVLVDDLLLLARLDAGRPLNREPVDMSRLAIDATSDARVARPGHRWVLELPDDPVLATGDEHRLHQVLVNLLSNAGRHTPDGTTVTVAVVAELPPGEPGAGPRSGAPVPGSVRHGTIPAEPRMVLSVTDDGPGIPADLLPDLFERFTRADTSRSHATNATSTGLGLAIVDAVVGAHDGAVLVTSRPGMTRFTIVLPRLTEPRPGEQPPPRPVGKALISWGAAAQTPPAKRR